LDGCRRTVLDATTGGFGGFTSFVSVVAFVYLFLFAVLAVPVAAGGKDVNDGHEVFSELGFE
jgi:hypothetical protein